jgi:DNA-binding transcriptional LysR family regulator
MCLVTAERAPEANLAALADRTWVLPPDDAACGQAVRLACRAAGFEPRVRWTSDDMLVLARVVAAGHGLSVLPRSAVPGEVRGLAVEPLAAPTLRRRVRAVTRPASASRPVICSVLDAVAESADELSR